MEISSRRWQQTMSSPHTDNIITRRYIPSVWNEYYYFDISDVHILPVIFFHAIFRRSLKLCIRLLLWCSLLFIINANWQNNFHHKCFTESSYISNRHVRRANLADINWTFICVCHFRLFCQQCKCRLQWLLNCFSFMP